MADALAAYGDTIDAAAREWGQDPTLLRALIMQESGGNAAAASPKGTFGLGQIRPQTAAGLGMTDPKDTTQQIFGAAKYLAEGYAKEGTPEGALLYYHGGPDWKKAYGAESAGYVPGVAAHYTRLKGGGGAATVAEVPSDDEFLKQAAPAAASAVPSDEEFLKSTGAAPAPGEKADTAAPAGPVLDMEGSVVGAPDPSPMDVLKRDWNALAPPIERIGGAMAQGWRSNPLMTDSTRSAIEATGPIGNYITSPVLQILGGVPGAIGGGVTQGVSEASAAAGVPTLARDLNPLLMTAGVVVGGGPGVPMTRGGLVSREMKAPVANILDPAADRPYLTADAADKLETSPALRESARPGAAPQPAGAQAATAAEASMTPAEVAAYRSTAEGQKLLESQPPGVRDTNAYVHGVDPNEAEIEQTVNTARELKSLGLRAEDVSQEARAVADSNNEARRLHFAQTAGSDVDVLNARVARSEQAQRDLQATWANKQEADAQPMLDVAAEIKASQDGRRPAVRNAVDAVTKELYDDNAELITDPELLYGVRKHLDDLLSKEGAATDPLSIRARGNLLQLKATLDGVIEQAAPGFGQYLKNFSDASRPIDAMEVLQKHENKLFGSQNRMEYNRVQTMMRQIVDSRANADPVSPYKSITDKQMQRLWALRDDLRRSASAQDLARAPGSDTAQNTWDILKSAARGPAGAIGAGIAGHAIGGPVGGAAMSFGKNLLDNVMSGRAARRDSKRGLEMLHPDRAKYPLRNPLDIP